MPSHARPALRLPPDALLPDIPAGSGGLAQARQALVEQIASLTGAHRVRYYDLYPDGDGEVLAEHCQDVAWGTYLGLRFPASDIPNIVRLMFLKQPWRHIPDASAEPVP